MKTTSIRQLRKWLIGFATVVLMAFGVELISGTVSNPHFWLTADQRGDGWFRQKKFVAAAAAYASAWPLGAAQYRNGDFKAAAKTFARVPGATGAFNQGNAWLMGGNYPAAIASYDRALGFHPGWKEAVENKALAIARQAKLEDSGKDRDQEQLKNDDEMTPDAVVFDPNATDKKKQPVEMSAGGMSDDDLQAAWLRQVQTTPGNFLRAKFAYQAAALEPKHIPTGGKEEK